ncbi:MAG: riboflavin biosynthesis protein RibF [candidate division Zixibacteria bacterium]|nr:riboflavin biosynthesis protein RibF [candidate division Zixibacteria bacterium]
MDSLVRHRRRCDGLSLRTGVAVTVNPLRQPPVITPGVYETVAADVGALYDGGAVVCVGTFDGVHRGHQAILAQARQVAADEGLTLVVVTFHPHPKSVVASAKVPCLLTAPDGKACLLRQFGAQHVLMMRFDEELAATSATDFVEKVIRHDLRAEAVVLGEDFRFGRGREGTPEFLREWGEARGLQVHMVEAINDPELDWRISSSAIRSLLKDGRFNESIRLLGHALPVSGRIISGAGRGKDLGYPTWNLHPFDLTLPPPVGIYAGWAGRATPRPAMAYYGSNPTFGETTPKLEAHVFNTVDGARPADEETIWLSAYIRDEIVFDSAEALTRQLAEDERHVRHMLLEETTTHTNAQER